MVSGMTSEMEQHASECTSVTDKDECEDVDFYHAQMDKFGMSDMQEDCDWVAK